MTFILRADAVRAAMNACLVPPDGGSPTDVEVELCNRIAQSLRDLPAAGGWKDLAAEAMQALTVALNTAEDAWCEWDKAPSGMKPGKLLTALCVPSVKYRADITAMHETRAKIDALLNAEVPSSVSNHEGE